MGRAEGRELQEEEKRDVTRLDDDVITEVELWPMQMTCRRLGAKSVFKDQIIP